MADRHELGGGAYMIGEKPGDPRDTKHHKKIIASEHIEGTHSGHRLKLECGHTFTVYGDPARLQGVVLCLRCMEEHYADV